MVLGDRVMIFGLALPRDVFGLGTFLSANFFFPQF